MSEGDQKKVYGGYKVSDYSTGKGRYVVDELEIEQHKENKDKFFKQLESDVEVDYKKKHKLGKDQKQFKEEYKSTRDALKEFSLFQWKKQFEYVKQSTPEEYETLLLCISELKANMRYYAFGFSILAFSFTYWQRSFLPRGFHIFSLMVGASAGVAYASIKTSLMFIEKMDALGKEYELSRMVKQDIFDTRPDLDSGMRAQYYMHQQKMNDERR